MADGANAEININLGEAEIRPPLLTGAPQDIEWHGVEDRRDNLDLYYEESVIPFLKEDLKRRGSRNEAAGFLFGRYCVDSETGRHFTQVVGYSAFPDDLVQPAPSSIVITPNAYAYQNRYLEIIDDPTLEIVGWAHSHPGYGLFLSASDDSVNAHYNIPGQLAVVYDPIREEGDDLAIFSHGGGAQPNEIANVRQTEFGLGFRRHRGFFTYRKEESVIRINAQDLSSQQPQQPIQITSDDLYKKGFRGLLQRARDQLPKKS